MIPQKILMRSKLKEINITCDGEVEKNPNQRRIRNHRPQSQLQDADGGLQNRRGS